MRAGASVKDITHQMQMIHYKTLYQFRQSDDKIRRTSYAYNGRNDLVIIKFLILKFFLLGDQFLYYLSKIFWKSLAHL